jgi:AcrR family transcriptional regulator
VPKVWADTIEEHKEAVRRAVLDATETLISSEGLAGISMSRIAGEAGIGRATLYKYFPNTQEVLAAWHHERVAAHLQALEKSSLSGPPERRLEQVLTTYARLSRLGDTGELARLLHRSPHVDQARRSVHELITDAIESAVDACAVRSDIPPAELATYCVHSLGAARDVRSNDGVKRLVALTLDALRPPVAVI